MPSTQSRRSVGIGAGTDPFVGLEIFLKRSLFYQIGTAQETDFERLAVEVRLAEDLGLDSVWCFPAAGESGDFSEGAPAIWLSALASQTRRIRLGWGIAMQSAPTRAPMRVAEQAASLDLASNGRLDLAFLPSAEMGLEDPDLEAEALRPEEAEAGALSSVAASARGRDAPWDEEVRMLVRMWEAGAFEWNSDRFAVAPVEVLPKPLQHPHPPLSFAGWQPEHAVRAGQGGMGYLDVSGADAEGIEVHRNAYIEGRARAEVDDLVNESAFVVAADLAAGEAGLTRLAALEELGIDGIVVRVGPYGAGEDEALERVRSIAGDGSRVH